jgi:ABC-type lipoprotein release transport system permease subunit
LVLAYVGSRALAGLLFQVRPGDPVAFLVAPGIFLGVAFLAAWLPARRASRVNPVTLLKAE